MEKNFFYFENAAPGSQLESVSAADDGPEKVSESVDTSSSVDNKNMWDRAHELRRNADHDVYVEPAVVYEYDNDEAEFLEGAETVHTEYDDFWPYPKDATGKPDKQIWHVGKDFSQLKDAWGGTPGPRKTIRIAHFDTGYDPEHVTYPGNSVIETTLQKNFVENNNSARDIGSEGWLRQPGHGTGTLSILAGTHVKLDDYHYDDYIGIHDGIKIVPIRMSRSVILWKSDAFVEAMLYIISLYDDPATRVHVVTMSMGGLPTKAWAEVINRAYEKGIFVVTAAGNNFGRLTPRTVIYPARFKRVVAACGVNFDYSPYYRPFEFDDVKMMQGNFGPKKAMTKAIAAFTPNVPWARIGTKTEVSIRGAGTSSATPQVAATAALYYQKYYDELAAMPEGWMRVETIREAMYKAALKKIAPGYENDVEGYFGNGILQAKQTLDIPPSAVASVIKKADKDKVSWPFIKMIAGLESAETTGGAEMEMYETEILQLIQQSPELQELLDNEEKDFNDLTEEEQRYFYDIILKMPQTSRSLKSYIRKMGW